jgi:cell division protein FtsI/penicillin-binding protein 2
VAEHAQRRLGLVFVLLGAMTLLLIARLVSVQIVQSADYRELGEEERVHELFLAEPPRGCIRDRNGLLIAGNRVRYAIEASPTFIADMETAVVSLTEILYMPYEVVTARPCRPCLWAASARGSGGSECIRTAT